MTAKYQGDRTPEIEADCKVAPFHLAIVDTGATERGFGVGGGEHGQDAAFVLGWIFTIDTTNKLVLYSAASIENSNLLISIV